MSDDFPPQIPGDLADLARVQNRLQSISTAASQARSQLVGSTQAVIWSGAAHDQFWTIISDLPSVLDKIATSFGMASSAVQSYVNSLDGVTSRYNASIQQYNDLRDQLRTTSQKAWAADQSGQDSSSLVKQGQSLEGELDPLARTLLSCLQDAAQAAAELGGRLDAASDAGIKDDFWNTLGRYGGDVGDFIGNVVTGIVNAVEDLVKNIIDLGETLLKAIDDLAHGNWSALGQDLLRAVDDINSIAQDLNNILGALAPLLALIPGVGEIVTAILLVTAIVVVVTDVVEVAQGKKGWGDVALDSINVALSVGGSAEEDVVKDLRAGKTGIVGSRIGLLKGHVTQSLRAADKGANADVHRAIAADFQKEVDVQRGALKDIASLPDKPSIHSLQDLRTRMSISSSETRDLQTLNPNLKLKFLGSHGVNVSYHAYKPFKTGAQIVTTGHDALDLAQHPSAAHAVTLGTDVVGDLTG